jgi:catechol 2,3-dioxygenase-like lactoylglutathione lyase family enzyme
MPKVNGVLETALYVADLDVSEAFYGDLFEFPTLIADERMRAFKICDTQILLLFKLGGSTSGEATPGGFIPPHDGRGQLHLAFGIELSEVEAWRAKLQLKGVEIESEVEANGGHSIYFRDPDGHCLELGTAQLWQVK